MYSRYRKWADAGLFEQIFCQLIEMPDMENISLDFASIRVHQKATGHKKARCDVKNQAIGISRGGITTKIHAVVDGLENSLRFHLKVTPKINGLVITTFIENGT